MVAPSLSRREEKTCAFWNTVLTAFTFALTLQRVMIMLSALAESSGGLLLGGASCKA